MPRDLWSSTGQQQRNGPRQRDAPWNDRGRWAAELNRPPPRRFPVPSRAPQVPPPLRSTVHLQTQNVFRLMAGRSDSRPATVATAAVEESFGELERVGAQINAALTSRRVSTNLRSADSIFLGIAPFLRVSRESNVQ